MTPEAINAYFTPLDYILYMMALLVGMVTYYQWKWAQVCKHNVLVLVQKSDGHGDFELAPQDGGSVSLKNRANNTTRLWPINELATIDVPYPGVGFVPNFLQKQIRMVIVSETDWEPLTNRSPNHEMIASPAFLGNLMHEKITEAVITVNKEMLDSIANVTKRLGKMVSPVMFFVGIGIVAIISIFAVYSTAQIASKTDSALDEIHQIQRSYGIQPIHPQEQPQTTGTTTPSGNKPLIPLK